MYIVTLLLGSQEIAEAKFKSITQVAKFVATCDLSLIDVCVTTPKGYFLSAYVIQEIWNA